MGTSNFLYRDTLYTLNTYYLDDDSGELLHDEFLYDDTKFNIIAMLNDYSKRDSDYTIYGEDEGCIGDNRYFEGNIVGSIYENFYLKSDYIDEDEYICFMIGDDFCLRTGYYSGFNFDRVVCDGRYYNYDPTLIPNFATNEIDAIKEYLYKRIYVYDKLRIDDAVENGELTSKEGDDLKAKIYNDTLSKVEHFIAEADRIYHEIGKEYFTKLKLSGILSNGEAIYEESFNN